MEHQKQTLVSPASSVVKLQSINTAPLSSSHEHAYRMLFNLNHSITQFAPKFCFDKSMPTGVMNADKEKFEHESRSGCPWRFSSSGEALATQCNHCRLVNTFASSTLIRYQMPIRYATSGQGPTRRPEISFAGYTLTLCAPLSLFTYGLCKRQQENRRRLPVAAACLASHVSLATPSRTQNPAPGQT